MDTKKKFKMFYYVSFGMVLHCNQPNSNPCEIPEYTLCDTFNTPSWSLLLTSLASCENFPRTYIS